MLKEFLFIVEEKVVRNELRRRNTLTDLFGSLLFSFVLEQWVIMFHDKNNVLKRGELVLVNLNACLKGKYYL